MSDEQLILKAQRGDIKAFDELVMKYAKRVTNTAYGMLSDYHDACDASQEVFLRVYKSLTSFRRDAEFSTWLYRITVNVCSDMLRKRITASSDSLDKESEKGDSVIQLSDDAHSPHEAVERAELVREVRRGVASLPDEYRTVITLHEFEGMPYEDIANVLDCPLGTVKSRINRAKKMLRKKFENKRELFL